MRVTKRHTFLINDKTWDIMFAILGRRVHVYDEGWTGTVLGSPSSNKVYQYQFIFYQDMSTDLYKISIERKAVKSASYRNNCYRRQWRRICKTWVETDMLRFCLSCSRLIHRFLRTRLTVCILLSVFIHRRHGKRCFAVMLGSEQLEL